MSKTAFYWVCVFALTLGSMANASTIVWVNQAYDTDVDGAQDDQPFVDLLVDQGYTVDVQQGNWTTLDAGKIAQLEAADLIIISRSTGSDQYAGDATEISQWNEITTPMILTTAYILRTSRWLWMNTTTVNNLTGPAIEVVDAAHPIFSGVKVEGGAVNLVDGTTGTGQTSFIGTTDSNGKLIAQTGANAAIVEWEAGTEFYPGSGQTAGGSRLFFACGTQESGATPQGGFNLTDEGIKAFLNAVVYMMGGDLNLATSPSPAMDAEDVWQDGTVLKWVSSATAKAHDVYFGTSMEDVNDASRSNGLGVLLSQNQDANALAIGHLELGQSYYWRVDEVNLPEIHKGSVWSFTAEQVSNPISGDVITATSSSVSTNDPDVMSAARTIDGSGLTGDAHSNADVDMWLSKNIDFTPWLQYEFDKPYELDKMMVWNANQAVEPSIGWGAKEVVVETSLDGVDWTVVDGITQFTQAAGSPGYVADDVFALNGLVARHVKISLTSNWGGLPVGVGLSEVRFYAIPTYAREPKPASGAMDVLPNAVASWRPGRGAIEHTVAVSQDSGAVTGGQAVADNTMSLESFDLQLGETYYWNVTESTDTSVWSGDIWNLTIADTLIVDDFESYSNLSPDRPFQTWLDGYGYSADEYFPVEYPGNGTGAGIGHDIWNISSPYYNGAIMEIVNTPTGTGQSMPFYYNNVGAAASQTDRTFAVPQDWTLGGAKTLSIALAGRADNGGTLYVKINNTKVTYEGDITLGLWQTWTLDLATVNTNLQSVTKLQIGVDGSGASGMILIDDIKLSADAPGSGSDGPTLVWVSFHGGDDAPSTAAAGAGFTEAPDKPYTDLLKANGYNVIRYVTTNAPNSDALNAADLVIISRSVASGGYQDDGATAWNSITAPMIITGGYTLRSSRMGFTTGTTIPDTAGDITLKVNDPSHPIFAGIELTGGSMVNPFAGIAVYPTDGTTVARGISVNTDPLNADGTLLATVETAGDPAAGGMVIGEWQAGAALTHTGGAGTDILGGHRLVFLTGAREANGISGDTAGLYDLYEDGEQMLLNAVEYMLQ
ncbi:MAG: discoidin domain-containing protein [Phycisphaerae bacterium]|nr:discoidin domain-containing protein [Phycisphaerae bacterium]